MTKINLNTSWQEAFLTAGGILATAAAILGGAWLSNDIEKRNAIAKIQSVQVAGSPTYMIVDGANRTNYYRHLGEFKVEKINLEREFQKMIDYSIPEGGLLRQ